MATVYCAEGFQFVATSDDVLASLNNQLGNVNSSMAGSHEFRSISDPYGVTRQILSLTGNSAEVAAAFTAPLATASVQAQINPESLAGTTVFRFSDTGTVHIYLNLVVSGSVLVPTIYRGDDSLLGTSLVSVSANQWHQYSCKATVDDSAGAVSLYLDGTLVINVTGADTRNGASAQITHASIFRSIGGPSYVSYCDFVVSDDHFANGVRVITQSPNADGDDTTWSRSAGAANWQALDDLPRSATDYIYSATVGAENSVKVAALPVSGSVRSVVDQIWARKSNADLRQITQFVKSGTKSYGSAITLGGTSAVYARKMDVNPVTSSPWAAADFGASGAQFGQKVEA